MRETFLLVDDYFAYAIWQKINLTGQRVINIEELKLFASEVAKEALKMGQKATPLINGYFINEFVTDYRQYVSYNKHEKTFCLNDGISMEQTMKIFRMGTLNNNLKEIMSCDRLGKSIFTPDSEELGSYK